MRKVANFLRWLSLSAAAAVVFACNGGLAPTPGHSVGTGTTGTGTSGTGTSGTGTSGSTPIGSSSNGGDPDASACVVLASQFDQSCVTDSDCVVVPPGGNVCNPCSVPNGAYQFDCAYATVNAGASAAYVAAIQPGVDNLKATINGSDQCGSTCPAYEPAVCLAGTCAIRPVIYDAGAPIVDDSGIGIVDAGPIPPVDGGCDPVVASQFDTSCNADSDCVLVPAGGSTCDVCSEPEAFGCDVTGLNAQAAPAYLAALANVVNGSSCVAGGSCFDAGAAVCVSHQCTRYIAASEDAGH